MKNRVVSLLLLHALLLGYLAHSQAFTCPAGGGDNAYYPDPANCSCFYQCVGSTAFHKPCPTGLNYNPNTQLCDYPANVICPGSTGTTPSTPTTTTQPLLPVPPFVCPTVPLNKYSLYGDPLNCSFFIACAGSKPFRKVCPPNLFYNEALYVCDFGCGVPVVDFLAVRVSNTTGASSKLVWQNVPINMGLAFNLTANKFVAPYDGYYWLHESVGINGYNALTMTLQGGNKSLSVQRSSLNMGGPPNNLEMFSRGDLMWLRKGQALQVATSAAVYSDSYRQTSWLGFRVDSIESPFIGLAVYGTGSTTNPPSGIPTYQKLPLSTVYVDSTGSWSNGIFTAPLTGVYFFEYVAVASYGLTQSIIVSPYINGAIASSNYPSIWFGSIRAVNSETLSAIGFFKLSKGNTFSLYMSGAADTYQVWLSGFFYHTVNGMANTAWSVTTNAAYTGAYNPLPFNTVLLNQGSAWKTNTNMFVAPAAGTYYVWLTGFHLEQSYRLIVQLNGVAITSLQQQYGNPYPTRSQATLIRLKANDILKVVQPAGYSMTTQVSFGGFRLHA